MRCPGCGVSVLIAFEPPEAVGMYLADAATNVRHTTAACVAARDCRAAFSADLVTVSRADLEMVLPLADGGPADYRQPSEWREAHRRLRDAVTRKEVDHAR